MPDKADFWIQKLQLLPHPEGGYYRENFRSFETISGDSLPNRYNSERNFTTSIYFLLKSNQVSAFHRLKSDEIWHFYQGAPIHVYLITKMGKLLKYTMGADIDAGQVFQLVIPFHCWFAATVSTPNSFALVGCSVSPGFDFNDFELADSTQLIAQYPQHAQLIAQMKNQ
ncbi:MAG: cupin domain-containing protein [Bacteroidota bacterium]